MIGTSMNQDIAISSQTALLEKVNPMEMMLAVLPTDHLSMIQELLKTAIIIVMMAPGLREHTSLQPQCRILLKNHSYYIVILKRGYLMMCKRILNSAMDAQ